MVSHGISGNGIVTCLVAWGLMGVTPVRRFFASRQGEDADLLTIQDDEYYHLRTVLRYSPGDELLVVDEQGCEFRALIEHCGDKEALVRVLEKMGEGARSGLSVVLLCALIKGNRFDLVVEKGTELGMSLLVPIVSERTVRIPSGHHVANRLERWQRIARSAVKQSGRRVPPHVREPLPFTEALNNVQEGSLKIILWEKAEHPLLKDVLREGLRTAKEVAIVVGPEGGFSDCEVEFARQNGYQPASLGSIVLRAETAAIAALAAVLYELPPEGY